MGLSQSGIDELLVGSDSTPPEPSAAVAVATSRPVVPDVTRILGLSVTPTVCLAEREMTIESILEITIGTIIEFDVSFDAELSLRIGNHPIGSGQAVKIGENFGMRVTKIEALDERIHAMG